MARKARRMFGSGDFWGMAGAVFLGAWVIVLLADLPASGRSVSPAAQDGPVFIGPDRCDVKCHGNALKAWEATKHFESWKRVPKLPKAKEIMGALGKKGDMRRDAQCIGCHFSEWALKPGDKPRARGGPSCESCHGGAEKWLAVHNNFGGPAESRAEKEDHRAERHAQVASMGMIRPGEIHKLASNCFGCHTVRDEKLVNTGAHPVGDGFELVAYSQGEVRHNFVKWKGAGNRENSPERLRLLFVVGQATKLQFALQGLAGASAEGAFSKAMVSRIEAARKALAAAESVAEVKAVLTAAEGADLKPGSGSVKEAAGKVAEATMKLEQAHDGSKLGAVDALLPKPSAYKGKVFSP